MPAQGGQTYLAIVGRAQRLRTVVGFKRRPTVVVMQRENAPFGFARLELLRPGERAVIKIHLEFVVAVELENALGRSGADEGEIACFEIVRELHAVEAAPDMAEAERADQALRDMVAFDDGERWITRRDFRSVGELKPAELQAARPGAKQPFEPHEALFEDQTRVLPAAGGGIRRAESELALRR